MKTFRSFFLLGLLGILLLTACTAAPAFLQPDSANAQFITDNSGSQPRLESVTFSGVIDAIADDSYTINGLVVRVDDQSRVAANLNVGASAQVSALLLPDRSRYALSIQPQAAGAAGAAEFKIYGLVQGMTDGNWQISGQTILVNASTQIETGIALGEWVEVEGQLLSGALSATKISREDASTGQTPGGLPTGYPAPIQTPGDEVEFYGTVESITNNVWMISGLTVHATAATEVKDGATVGDMVKVHATLQADGTYLAREIEKSMGGLSPIGVPGGGEVEFYGLVTSITGDTWLISNQTVRTTAATEIKDGATVGDMVKVHATLQADGTYLAREIEKSMGGINPTEVPGGGEVEFYGLVTSINGDTWMIAGWAVRITPATEIKDGSTVGDEVKVHATLQADGTYLAREIEIDTDNGGGDDNNDDNGDDDNNDDNNDDNGDDDD